MSPAVRSEASPHNVVDIEAHLAGQATRASVWVDAATLDLMRVDVSRQAQSTENGVRGIEEAITIPNSV